MHETILRLINSADGITDEKLRLELMAEYNPITLDINEYRKVIQELVEKGKIIRITFVIPPKPKKRMFTGHLYLPERTALFVNNNLDRTSYKSQR